LLTLEQSLASLNTSYSPAVYSISAVEQKRQAEFPIICRRE